MVLIGLLFLFQFLSKSKYTQNRHKNEIKKNEIKHMDGNICQRASNLACS